MIDNFEKYIPKFFNRDDKLRAFAEAHDIEFEDLQDKIKHLACLRDVVRTPFIDELGYHLNAGLQPFDSNRTKRQKVYSAIEGHKARGRWDVDAKPKIDAIAGGDSKLVKSLDSADWILFGKESDDPDNYWATLGTDVVDTSDFVFESDTDFILVEAADTSSNGTIGTDGAGDFGGDLMGSQVGATGDTQLGIDLIGAGDEIEIPGNVYIDVDNRILTEEEVNQIKISLGDTVPDYFMVYLGYFNNDGQFIVYPNGVIG